MGTKKSAVYGIWALALAVCTILLLSPAPRLFAADATEAPQLNAANSLAANLASLKGRQVIVTLAGGQAVAGTVKDVSGNLLHLEKLSQKEFYDGLIVLDKIADIEVRVR